MDHAVGSHGNMGTETMLQEVMRTWEHGPCSRKSWEHGNMDHAVGSHGNMGAWAMNRKIMGA
jgi:hypothetical protein